MRISGCPGQGRQSIKGIHGDDAWVKHAPDLPLDGLGSAWKWQLGVREGDDPAKRWRDRRLNPPCLQSRKKGAGDSRRNPGLIVFPV